MRFAEFRSAFRRFRSAFRIFRSAFRRPNPSAEKLIAQLRDIVYPAPNPMGTRGPDPVDRPDILKLLRNPLLTFQDIADKVGLSRQRVGMIARRYGVTGEQRRPRRTTLRRELRRVLRKRKASA